MCIILNEVKGKMMLRDGDFMIDRRVILIFEYYNIYIIRSAFGGRWWLWWVNTQPFETYIDKWPI